MITLSNVTFSWPPSFRVTCSECGSVNSPHPSNSVILFFFIRKWTPLTRPSATTRLRSNAAPKSKVTSPEMPNVFASSRTRWASSALRSRALEGMQPTLRQTPPQYLDSTTATLLPSWAARMAATYPPGPAPRTTTSKCGMRTAYAWDRSGRRAGAEGRPIVTHLAADGHVVATRLVLRLGERGAREGHRPGQVRSAGDADA